MEDELKASYGVKAVQSLSVVAKELNRSRNGGRQDSYSLPETLNSWNMVIHDLEKLQKAGKLDHLIDESANYSRIFGRIGDWGADDIAERNTGFELFMENSGLSELYSFTVTGNLHMADSL